MTDNTREGVQPVKGGPSEAAIKAAAYAVQAKLPPGAQFGPTLNALDAIGFSEAALAAAFAVDEPRIRADQTQRIVEWLRASQDEGRRWFPATPDGTATAIAREFGATHVE